MLTNCELSLSYLRRIVTPVIATHIVVYVQFDIGLTPAALSIIITIIIIIMIIFLIASSAFYLCHA